MHPESIVLCNSASSSIRAPKCAINHFTKQYGKNLCSSSMSWDTRNNILYHPDFQLVPCLPTAHTFLLLPPGRTYLYIQNIIQSLEAAIGAVSGMSPSLPWLPFEHQLQPFLQSVGQNTRNTSMK